MLQCFNFGPSLLDRGDIRKTWWNCVSDGKSFFSLFWEYAQVQNKWKEDKEGIHIQKTLVFSRKPQFFQNVKSTIADRFVVTLCFLNCIVCMLQKSLRWRRQELDGVDLCPQINPALLTCLPRGMLVSNLFILWPFDLVTAWNNVCNYLCCAVFDLEYAS